MLPLLSLLALAATIPIASTQLVFGNSNAHREPEAIPVATLTVNCLFTLLFLGQIALCVAVVRRTTEHRKPYLVLLSTIVLHACFCATSVPRIALEQWCSRSRAAAFFAAPIMFYNWSLVLLYATIIAFLRDREAALQSQWTRRSAIAPWVHAAFVVLLCVFGTAAAASRASMDKAKARQHPWWFEFDRLENAALSQDCAFQIVLYLSALDIIVTARALYKAAESKGLSDKVTNVVLFAFSPIYVAVNLMRMVLLILGSPNVRSKIIYFRDAAELAHDVIFNASNLIIFSTLLVLSLRRDFWDVRGGVSLPGRDLDSEQPPSYYSDIGDQ